MSCKKRPEEKRYRSSDVDSTSDMNRGPRGKQIQMGGALEGCKEALEIFEPCDWFSSFGCHPITKHPQLRKTEGGTEDREAEKK
ncbi:uncharacterized protein SPSK_10176 [Sporothrix schenckii 1099-18]|uniref:Uncharacterized protein n=1 Tax=Sporothrix schenckii 1099-18 TaxID=1397361 RepID=A0A0F2M7Q3_SPOSC|nr:uncharacterized protein SPSK_10176 [Sporothrix schenckii 1099-18]KJR85667.1 hypothetical protein SPSK_10176 [Sporothrix schenckii 1099-18]